MFCNCLCVARCKILGMEVVPLSRFEGSPLWMYLLCCCLLTDICWMTKYKTFLEIFLTQKIATTKEKTPELGVVRKGIIIWMKKNVEDYVCVTNLILSKWKVLDLCRFLPAPVGFVSVVKVTYGNRTNLSPSSQVHFITSPFPLGRKALAVRQEWRL